MCDTSVITYDSSGAIERNRMKKVIESERARKRACRFLALISTCYFMLFFIYGIWVMLAFMFVCVRT